MLVALLFAMAAPPGLAAIQPATPGLPTLGVIQQWSVSAPDANPLDEFGYTVAIDGNTAVIGARNADPDLGGGSIEGAGAAYVYVHDGKTWVLDAKLTAKDPSPRDTFGVSVAISGNTILIGATGVDLPDEDDDEEDGQLKEAGAAYVFARISGEWVQQAILTAADRAEDDSFGSAVALYKNTAVVAAESKDLFSLVDVGAAYVFYNSGGKNWKQQAKLLPPDPWLGDNFGASVAVHGNLVAVGATQLDPTDVSGPGKVILFKRDGVTWTQEAYLEEENGRSGDAFGNSVDIYGRTVVVGATRADPRSGTGRITSAGAAYVYTDNGNEWVETAALTAPYGLPFDQFGQSVGIYGDTIVIGADGATQAGNTRAGAVYVFKKSGSEWNMQTRAVTDPAGEGDLFGKSVGVSGNWFVVGASGRHPDAKSHAGEAFLSLLGAVQLPAAGFAPGVQTQLPVQPESLAYQDSGALQLEIPALGVQMPITGVPQSGAGWDVRWLGDQAGYLEGTAFPTWEGNTGIAGHTVLADGGPGPFARLYTLGWGDPVIIHAWGKRYIYEVRETSLVKPEALAVLKHEELDWVTLITCQDFDPSSGAYRWRRVVRAVLVSVQE
jgi:LPXTG-site transpeptidase (sortase) family protein